MIRKSKLILFIIVIITFTSILFISCSKQEKGSAIQSVIELMFNCPNEELINLFDNMENEIDITKGEDLLQTQTEFSKKLDELYKPYFTESGYETFYNSRFPFTFHLDAYETGNILKVNKVTITPNKKSPTNYTFTAEILYGLKDGEQSKFEVNGSAQLQENDDKITIIQFFNVDDLLKEMSDIK